MAGNFDNDFDANDDDDGDYADDDDDVDDDDEDDNKDDADDDADRQEMWGRAHEGERRPFERSRSVFAARANLNRIIIAKTWSLECDHHC